MRAHSDDRDQSFQRIASSVARVRDGAVGCCWLISVFALCVKLRTVGRPRSQWEGPARDAE